MAELKVCGPGFRCNFLGCLRCELVGRQILTRHDRAALVNELPAKNSAVRNAASGRVRGSPFASSSAKSFRIFFPLRVVFCFREAFSEEGEVFPVDEFFHAVSPCSKTVSQ